MPAPAGAGIPSDQPADPRPGAAVLADRGSRPRLIHRSLWAAAVVVAVVVVAGVVRCRCTLLPPWRWRGEQEARQGRQRRSARAVMIGRPPSRSWP